MFDHVTIGASDAAASRRFYALVLATLGRRTADDLSIAQAGADRPVTTRLHIGFAAPTRAHVDAFWRAGIDAGHRDDGAPGPRPEYSEQYYGGFLLDPDGNSAEAVVHGDTRGSGSIDHLWWRVADREAARRFYATVGEAAGFREVAHLPDRTRFSPGPGLGSFSIVDGDAPTTPFHVAFTAGGTIVRDPDGHGVEALHHTR